MKSYDVIIVGAGPAGLKCAETLGNTGYKILILEKKSKIGPKVCAAGLTRKCIEEFNIPKKLIEHKSNKVKVHLNKNCIAFKSKENYIYTTNREKLGQWQLKRLKDYENINIKTNSRVSEIRNNYVLVNGKKIKYNYLVGADGSNSIVRKYLGIKSKITIAMQYKIDNEYDDFEIFVKPKLFSSGYAWIFPHKGYSYIGAGCSIKVFPPKKLLKNLKYWLKENNINISKSKYEAYIINYDYQGHNFKNIFLAGDAAGFTEGLTGEGIYQAMISGKEIAKIIMNPNYKSKRIKKLLVKKRKQELILKLLNKSGRFKNIWLSIGKLVLKIPYFKKKLIRLVAY